MVHLAKVELLVAYKRVQFDLNYIDSMYGVFMCSLWTSTSTTEWQPYKDSSSNSRW